MTIASVHTWEANERLSKTQITQLDKNISYVLDKRAGHTDTLESDITFDVNGIVIGTGSKLTIDNPANVYIPDSYLSTDATLSNKTLPIRTGYIEIALPKSGTYVLTLGQMANQHICFTGHLTANSKVQFSHSIGWTKIIETRYTSSDNLKTLELTCGDNWGGSTVIMHANQCSSIYGNDLDLIEIKSTSNLCIVDQISMKVNGSISPPSIVTTPILAAIGDNIPSDKIYSNLGGGLNASIINNTTNIAIGDLSTSDITFSNLTTDGKALFLDVKEGDQFEIFLSGTVRRAIGAANTVSWMSPLVSYGKSYITDSIKENYISIYNPITEFFNEAIVATVDDYYSQGSSKTIWIAPYDCIAEFKLFLYYITSTPFDIPGVFPTAVYSPFSYTIKQYRRI